MDSGGYLLMGRLCAGSYFSPLYFPVCFHRQNHSYPLESWPARTIVVMVRQNLFPTWQAEWCFKNIGLILSLFPQISQWLPMLFRRQFNSLPQCTYDQASAYLVCLLSDHSLSPSMPKWHWSQTHLTHASSSPRTFPIAVPLDAFTADLHVVAYFFSSFRKSLRVLPWSPDLKSWMSLPASILRFCFLAFIELLTL